MQKSRVGSLFLSVSGPKKESLLTSRGGKVSPNSFASPNPFVHPNPPL